MSLSAIGSIATLPPTIESTKATSAPSASLAPALPADTVTISPAAQSKAVAGDGDHDGH